MILALWLPRSRVIQIGERPRDNNAYPLPAVFREVADNPGYETQGLPSESDGQRDLVVDVGQRHGKERGNLLAVRAGSLFDPL